MEHGKRESIPERPPHRQGTKKKRQGSSAGHRVLFVLGTLVLIGVCTSAIIAGIFMKYVNTTLAPTLYVNADDYNMSYSSFVYYQDKETQEWKEYQTLYGEVNRVWVDIEDVPDALWQAVVAIEDERFFEHNGVDWKRTAGATLNMFIGMRDTFGGSTITQQLLKNMTLDNAGTVNRKVREIFRALEFEKNYSKKDILELYLNYIYLGKNCYGVQTAAQFYFGKDVSELTTAECACLIAITNNPSMYGPMSDIEVPVEQDDGTIRYKTPRELNKERQERILDKMCSKEVVGPATLEGDYMDSSTWGPFLTEEEAQAAKDEVLQFTDGTTSTESLTTEVSGASGINSWFVDQVILDVSKDLAEVKGISEGEARTLLYSGGYKIYTTLDPEIQEIAESVYEDRGNLNNLTSSDGQPIRSGITIMDPYTGDIVALVGDMGEKTGNLITNYATQKRQPGSSIKPVTVYAPALDAGAITMASTFDNYPVRLLNGTPWPKNSPNTYTGMTTLATGVAKSINTVAIQALERVGVTEAYAFATENLHLGLVAQDMNESPLGLGGLTYGLSTVEMAAAYSTFANGGIYNSPRTYVRVEDRDGNVVLENETQSEEAMKETTAYFMNKLLKGAVANGTGSSANFSGMTIAGKTGTTNDNYTRYFVGYTPYYVAAVWTGYQYNARVSYNGNPAITLWKKIMQQVHEDLPYKDFETPSSGLVTVKVCKDSGMLAGEACALDPRQDRIQTVTVAAGTAPTETCTMHVVRDYCTEGNCLAGEYCPESSVVQRAFLDHVREDYGPNIKADDDAYLLSTVEEAFAETGCTVHSSETVVPENPEDGENPAIDPNDPNYDPSGGFGDENMDDSNNGNSESNTGGNSSGGNSGGGNTGNTGDDWWSGFWNSGT